MSTEPTVVSSTLPIEQKHKHKANSIGEVHHIYTSRWNRHDALYLLVLVLLVAAMAYRYTPDLTGEVAGMWWDPLLNIWTLSWDTHTLLSAPMHLWQAQLLYPNNLTLSYSENLLGEVIFFAPVFLMTHNPVLAYNVTFYTSFLLCGTNMYIAARYYTGKPLAAFVAALIYAFAPYRLGQIDHIHIVAGEWIPLAFLYLDESLQRSKWRHWSLFALFYVLQLLSSIYYGIFLSYALLAYVLIRYTKQFVMRLRGQKGEYLKFLMLRAIRPAVVFTITFSLLGVLMAPYLVSLSHGFARSTIQSARYSAFVHDFIFTAPFNWLHGRTTYHGVPILNDSEHFLFLGWTTLALAALGTVLALRRRNPAIRSYGWTALIVLLFAFGPFLQYATSSGAPLLPTQPLTQPFPPAWPMPWLLAYYVLPGFQGLRVPARLIGVLLMMLALLAGYIVAGLQEILQRRTSREIVEQTKTTSFPRSSFLQLVTMQCILILIPLAIILEAVPAYLPVTHVPTGNSIPAVYQWLGAHDDHQPIVELPMAHLDENFITKDEAWYDYYALYHNHPIVNGWSGYRPLLTTTISTLLLNFPSQDSLNILKKYHIQYVVLHSQIYLRFYSHDTLAFMFAKMKASSELHLTALFGSDLLSSDSIWQVR